MKRFLTLLTTVIVFMLLFCSCGTMQQNPTNVPTETTALPPPEVEVLAESERSKRVITARSTLSEALEDDQWMYLDSTGWGYDQRKATITITGNKQNIVSVQMQQAIYLTRGETTGFYSTSAEKIEYVKEPGRLVKIEPWIDAEETPTMILEIKLEDGSLWFVAIRAKGF